MREKGDSMNIGKLRNRITIKNVTNIINNSGFADETEEVFASFWAEVIPISSKEFYSNAFENIKNIIKFRIRYLKGITSGMKVEFQGNAYNIKGIMNIDMRYKELILICELIQNV